MRRVNSLNSALVNLGSWSTTSTSGIPSPERSAISCGIRRRVGRARWHRMGLTGEGIDVRQRLVEARRHHAKARQPV